MISLANYSCFIYTPASLEHFWGAILQRATEVIEELLGSHQSRRAEIYQPNVETFVYDDVLIFYVAVKNVLCPEIEDSSYELGREGFKQSDTVKIMLNTCQSTTVEFCTPV